MQFRNVKTTVYDVINDVVLDSGFVARVTAKGTGLPNAFKTAINKDSAKLSEGVKLKAGELVSTCPSTAHATASKVRRRSRRLYWRGIQRVLGHGFTRRAKDNTPGMSAGAMAIRRGVFPWDPLPACLGEPIYFHWQL